MFVKHGHKLAACDRERMYKQYLWAFRGPALLHIRFSRKIRHDCRSGTRGPTLCQHKELSWAY